MEATTKWLDRLRQAKPGNLRIVFLAVSLFPAPLALSLDTVPSYTPEQLRENAASFLAVREKKKSVTTQTAVRATEFNGYVAGMLDARTGAFNAQDSDPKLGKCVRRKPVADIAYRAAVVITSKPLNRSLPASTNLALSLYLACEDSLWTSGK